MTLTLELRESSEAAPGRSSHVFGEDGGTIGRAPTNSWVIPHNKVSGLHARISCRDGVFYIEDTSRNGVCVNSPENRLVRNRPYALKSGDRLLIEPYEIAVWVEGDRVPRGTPADDPFSDADPFLPPRAASPSSGRVDALLPDVAGEVDPLKFFDPVGGPPRPSRRELPPADGLGQHYQPPVPVRDPLAPAAPPPAPSGLPSIPAGYNPLADEPTPASIAPPPAQAPVRPRPGDSAMIRARRDSGIVPRRPRTSPPVPVPPPAQDPFAPMPASGTDAEAAPPVTARPTPPIAPPPLRDEPPVVPPVANAAAPPAAMPPPALPAWTNRAAPTPEHSQSGADATPPSGRSADLAALLAGAGVPDAVVTPELSGHLGEILKVVVAGLMDVLQSRQRIKEEFRMQQTIFRQADNNPLKFSVNVEDALHNLLVKRNPAYLKPVEAFADAFDDLRDHQLAMLAGMRVAFETMLAAFDPDRLQKEFDDQLGKSSLALMPAKLRYWDLYRARRAELVKDPEESFDRLFGQEFRRAYEEQFRQLKAQRRARATPPGPAPE